MPWCRFDAPFWFLSRRRAQPLVRRAAGVAQYRDPVDIDGSTDGSETVDGHVAERAWVGEEGPQVPADLVAKLLDVDTVVRHANVEAGHHVGIGHTGLGRRRFFPEQQGVD